MNKAAAAFLIIFLSWAGVSGAIEVSEWMEFKDHFISRDGRVIDYVNNRITTSEGQSYAMLVAVNIDDRQTFDLLWEWTKNNLQVRTVDRLLAWKWGERLPGTWDIIDLNNATDADVLTALALLEAEGKWHNEEYRAEALSIMKSIQEKLVVEKWGKMFTLPGYFGFTPDNRLVINPSYLIVPAYKKFAGHTHQEFWNILYGDSLSILERSTYGKYGLPADWVVWDPSGPQIFSEKNDLFGYEAIRVFLYLSWEHNVKLLNGLEAYLDFVAQIGYLPSTVNLSEDTISLHDAPGGFYAVFARAAGEAGRQDQSNSLWEKAGQKIIYEKDDYYSNILYLLSKIKLN